MKNFTIGTLLLVLLIGLCLWISITLFQPHRTLPIKISVYKTWEHKAQDIEYTGNYIKCMDNGFLIVQDNGSVSVVYPSRCKFEEYPDIAIDTRYMIKIPKTGCVKIE